jgi:hypothetical protein
LTRSSGEIRMCCERRMGETLQAGQERGEIARHRISQCEDVQRADIQSATYKDLGLTRRQAAELKVMARPVAEQFEAIVAEATSNQMNEKRVRKLRRDLPCAHGPRCARQGRRAISGREGWRGYRRQRR